MAGLDHTGAWTEAGELFTFGHEQFGKLGHGGQQDELVPRLVDVLAGKRVASATTLLCGPMRVSSSPLDRRRVAVGS